MIFKMKSACPSTLAEFKAREWIYQLTMYMKTTFFEQIQLINQMFIWNHNYSLREIRHAKAQLCVPINSIDILTNG